MLCMDVVLTGSVLLHSSCSRRAWSETQSDAQAPARRKFTRFPAPPHFQCFSHRASNAPMRLKSCGHERFAPHEAAVARTCHGCARQHNSLLVQAGHSVAHALSSHNRVMPRRPPKAATCVPSRPATYRNRVALTFKPTSVQHAAARTGARVCGA